MKINFMLRKIILDKQKNKSNKILRNLNFKFKNIKKNSKKNKKNSEDKLNTKSKKIKRLKINSMHWKFYKQHTNKKFPFINKKMQIKKDNNNLLIKSNKKIHKSENLINKS